LIEIQKSSPEISSLAANPASWIKIETGLFAVAVSEFDATTGAEIAPPGMKPPPELVAVIRNVRLTLNAPEYFALPA
jgi:hypothetical protein